MKYQGQLLSFVAVLALAACGGGGGGTAESPVQEAPKAAPSTIVTEPASSTYAAGSEKRDAFNYLNTQRQTCGFGTLQQSTAIDAAAQAHTDYLTSNNIQRTHYENQTQFPAGFTGVTSADRVKAAGYDYAGSEGREVIGEALASSYGVSTGQAVAMNLFVSPFHGLAMLLGDRDVGLGYTASSTEMVVNFAYSTTKQKQLLAGDAVATFPCVGVTGVLSRTYYNEEPAPITGRDLQSNPIGHPIYLKVRDGQTLTLTSTDLRVEGSGTAVATQVLNKSNDPSGLIGDASSAIVMPLAPLNTNATYVFKAEGTNDGKPFTVNFTFITGAF